MRPTILLAMAGTILFLARPLCAQDASHNPADFEKNARKLREAAILKLEPQVATPQKPRDGFVSAKFPWKTNVVSTVFWIGSAEKGEDDHGASAWDPKWKMHYGGFDDPDPQKRHHFIPVGFIPRQNPFYIALPYNDVAEGVTKPEAKVVIPWFQDAFVEEGKSVCRDRWLAIRNSAGKVCYAQWSDCGPFGSDQWQYVFGNEKPKPNLNSGAGLNVSPAVREYLQLQGTDVVDWKFMETKDVPNGPWALFGDNNPLARPGAPHSASEAPPAGNLPSPDAAPPQPGSDVDSAAKPAKP
ncbi:hypothetical protein CfE428DRAFT_4982 [Chthoniobacter flavus Ellin428]|uniref:DUF1329 domain-containing protein n=1 Tax=Chthoniobacter flavus Ellin428 TaxID=497964 RepID=B4D7U2_9BACT|nr:hypothetical protein [Chthoniobacter flavus]EDY17465.1 hypothetical protein CfE428DRAFT_4982 [Chthoniobacter flavus Ellin428]TCO92261.1 hypothetical protein EV701_10630 [Chthoniobacter flavus]